MGVLKELQLGRVFEIFEEICDIPHGSGNTDAISAYCLQFAEKLGLEAWKDAGGNVVIKKPASAGYENAEPVILQGHFDMVAEKADDCPLDMAKDGLRLFVDGDWIGAEGTTLGGDDGIAVAMALAALEDDSLEHPALEVLLTRDEETGMYGALEMDGEGICGRRLINIDSEDEGVFTVSCAGGVNVEFEMETQCAPVTGEVISLVIDGLTGGHSGVEIHHGRANAYVLLGIVLTFLNCRIVSIGGGGKHNAIARRAEAVLCVEGKWEEHLRAAEEFCKLQYCDTDPDLRFTVVPAKAEMAMTERSSNLVRAMLSQVPDGVVKMSEDIEGLVQTSVNRGVIEADCNKMSGVFSIRSSVAAERDATARVVMGFVEGKGARVEAVNEYPAWEYRKDSQLRELMVETFGDMYGKKPEVVAIHAGLECGILSEKLPGLDAVSIGPDMQNIHTPQERLCISSVERVWDFVKEILRRMKA